MLSVVLMLSMVLMKSLQNTSQLQVFWPLPGNLLPFWPNMRALLHLSLSDMLLTTVYTPAGQAKSCCRYLLLASSLEWVICMPNGGHAVMAEMLVYEAGYRFSVQCDQELVLGHVTATYLCTH